MDTKKFYGLCLQGDVLGAIKYLDLVEDKDQEGLILQKKYEERFMSGTEVYEIKSEDLWIREVVGAYITYFNEVLTGRLVEEAEKVLTRTLLSLVDGEADAELDDVELLLGERFKEKGYSFLGGVTAPYRGPCVWKTTREKVFKVELPDGEQDMTVYFITNFVMQGWAHFATMGRHYAAGWAKPEGLYYVDHGVEPIDIESDWFQITFLKHEAQHLNDFKAFPHLNSRNLEYRAKLVELIYYPESYSVARKFLNEAKNDKAFPHSYAAYRIIGQLSSLIFDKPYIENKLLWKEVDRVLISTSALHLLLQNNKDLLALGIEAEGVI